MYWNIRKTSKIGIIGTRSDINYFYTTMEYNYNYKTMLEGHGLHLCHTDARRIWIIHNLARHSPPFLLFHPGCWNRDGDSHWLICSIQRQEHWNSPPWNWSCHKHGVAEHKINNCWLPKRQTAHANAQSWQVAADCLIDAQAFENCLLDPFASGDQIPQELARVLQCVTEIDLLPSSPRERGVSWSFFANVWSHTHGCTAKGSRFVTICAAELKWCCHWRHVPHYRWGQSVM